MTPEWKVLLAGCAIVALVSWWLHIVDKRWLK